MFPRWSTNMLLHIQLSSSNYWWQRKENSKIFIERISHLVNKANGRGVQAQLNHESEKLTSSEKVPELMSGKSIIRAVEKTKNVVSKNSRSYSLSRLKTHSFCNQKFQNIQFRQWRTCFESHVMWDTYLDLIVVLDHKPSEFRFLRVFAVLGLPNLCQFKLETVITVALVFWKRTKYTQGPSSQLNLQKL